jgi:aspartate/methionine/tyrosine aminotransferase
LLNQIASPRPATRTGLLGFSDIVKIRNRVLEMKNRGEQVIQLEGGEPFSPTPEFIKDSMKAALDQNLTRYAPSSGLPQLLKAITEKLKSRNRIEVTEQETIVVQGGMHGLFCAFQAAVDPGDEVIFFSPYWTPINDLVQFAGGTSVRIDWKDVSTATDLKKTLEKKITKKTKVIYVNSPSNPTGHVLEKARLEVIAEAAIRNNLIVIADEAYESIIYDEPHVSIASLTEMAPRTITVYTLSKTFSMTGWRIGYVVAPPAFMDGVKKLVLNSVNGISTPTQFAALAAISQGQDFVSTLLPEYRKRRDMLVDGVLHAGFKVERPRGAFYLLVDVRERLGGDSWAAMESLLGRTGIATVPGVVFGPEGEGHLRMSYSNSMETLERAVEALRTL